MGSILINYAYGCEGTVNKMCKSFLTCLLMNVHNKVLFVGEGNYTFTTAFAAMRRLSGVEDVWSTICATDYDNYLPVPLDQAKVECIKYIIKHHKMGKVGTALYISIDGTVLPIGIDPEEALLLTIEQLVNSTQSCTVILSNVASAISQDYKAYAEVVEKIKAVVSLPELKPNEAWQSGVDARILAPLFPQQFSVIWFQCPWTPRYSELGGLIRSFLLNLVGKIKEGSFVCIGIANLFPYVTNYDLASILGPGLCCSGTEVLQHYNFCGGDDEFIKDILSYGYHHQGRKDIHDTIINSHLTLVFEKKMQLQI